MQLKPIEVGAAVLEDRNEHTCAQLHPLELGVLVELGIAVAAAEGTGVGIRGARVLDAVGEATIPRGALRVNAAVLYMEMALGASFVDQHAKKEMSPVVPAPITKDPPMVTPVGLDSVYLLPEQQVPANLAVFGTYVPVA